MPPSSHNLQFELEGCLHAAYPVPRPIQTVISRLPHRIPGERPQENIKITTPDDFYTMRALLDAKEEAQIFGFEAEDK